MNVTQPRQYTVTYIVSKLKSKNILNLMSMLAGSSRVTPRDGSSITRHKIVFLALNDCIEK